MSSLDFCRLITKHFWISFDGRDVPAAKKAVHLLSRWLHLEPSDLNKSQVLLDMIQIFIEELGNDGLDDEARELETTIASFVESKQQSVQARARTSPDALSNGTSVSPVMLCNTELCSETFGPDVTTKIFNLARELARGSLKSFRNTLNLACVRDWFLGMKPAMSGKQRPVRGFAVLIQRNQRFERWIAEQILLTTSENVEIQVGTFIQLVEALRLELDFNSVICVVLGLSDEIVQNHISAVGGPELLCSTRIAMDGFCDSLATVFDLLRSPGDQPTVPPLSCLLRDLLAIHGSIPGDVLDVGDVQARAPSFRSLLKTTQDASRFDVEMISIEKLKLCMSHNTEQRVSVHN